MAIVQRMSTFFVISDNHRKLTIQLNIDGDPLISDNFAYATSVCT
jgi:catechol 1,2-dioxygenase